MKTIGVNALTAKVLCKKHNSLLSPLDAAAKDVWCVLRYISDLNGNLGEQAREQFFRLRQA